MASVEIVEFSRLGATTPNAAGLDWSELVARLTTFTEREIKDGPGWSPAIYEDDTTRGNENVLAVTAAVIDIDHDEPEWGLLNDFEYVAHTTYSHMEAENDPHWRVILPFSKPVRSPRWKDTWRKIQFWLAPAADEACKDESRFYWWPTCQPGAPREVRHHEGQFLDPDTLRDVPEHKPPLRIVDRPVGEPDATGERPGDRFTRETDWSEILRGWRLLSTRGAVRKWERPENGIPKKTPGCSATTGGGGHDVLYVFSSNAQPFDPNTSYTKFRAYSLIEYGGDDKAAASELGKRYRERTPTWTWTRPETPSEPSVNGKAPAPEQPQAPPAPNLRSLTAEELILGDPTPVPWLIHAPPDEAGNVPGGLLAEGDVGIIGAASGTGKTWLGAELSYSLAAASPLFDAFTVARPCRVMIVDEESSAWLLRRRWLQILKGHNIAPEDFVERHWPNLKVYVDNGFSFDNDRTLEALYIEALSFQPDIVLFDTLARVHRRPENDNSEIAKLFEDRIKPFKREFGCSLFFLHHLRKASKDAPNDPASMLRGAGDLKGQLDQFWFLRGQSGESRAIFEHDKCRAMPELPSFVIERVDTGNGGVRVLKSGALGAVGATAAEQHQDVILTYLIDVQRATRQQIVDFAKSRGIGHTNVGIALRALVDCEQVDRARLGHEVEFFPTEVM